MPADDIYTVMLLHYDGADASTTFTDESGKTVTPFDNVQIDTAQSVFGGASGLFDGTTDRLTLSDDAAWQVDGGADANKWTWDARIRFNGDPGTGVQGMVQQYVDDDNFWAIRLSNNTLNIVVRSGASNIVNISNAWNPADATWYHVAVVKDGTNGYMMFVDGTQIGTTQTDTSTIPDFAAGLTIGRYLALAGASYFNGWRDEERISKGIARWTTNFTPPAAAYTPPSGFFMFF